jgi:hypothetical protein
MAERDDRPPPSSPERAPADAPHHTPPTRAEKAARDARLAAELRQNLLKRKRQQRARGDRTPSRD